jgi:hypothetical protein
MMVEGGGAPNQPTEEELRAALEEEMRRITVDDVLLQTVVSLVNLGARRAGLAPGTEDERDLDQVHRAIEGVRALLPLVPERQPGELEPINDAVARLQMAYAKLAQEGGPAAAPADAPEGAPGTPPKPDEPAGPGPAQSSGRLWVPGQ